MTVEVLIPPSVLPVSPVDHELTDDGSASFVPKFARGRAQSQVWSAPRWRFRPKFEAMRGSDNAALARAIAACQGRGGVVRWSPGIAPRGSFPATELLTNNDFSNGTTGWTAGSQWSLSSSDYALRSARSAVSVAGDAALATLSSGLSQYAPYAGRFFINGARGYPSSSTFRIDDRNNTVSGSTLTGFGMLTQSIMTGSGGNIQLALVDLAVSGIIAGDHLNIGYSSLTRGMQVDNGPNLFTYSEQIDHANWTKGQCTISANSGTAPDGTSTADSMQETAVTNTHEVSEAQTVSSAAADYCLCAAIASGTRGFVQLVLTESTGGTSAFGYFNLTTGAVGTTGTGGANWSNVRTFIVDKGNTWRYVCVIARKVNAATTVTPRILAATADGTNSYLGVAATNAIYIWRPTFAQSSLPVRLSLTTSGAIASGTAQSGSSVYVKGLPASTSGLLLSKDWVEINGQLVRLTASLDSDAAGLGYLQFGPSLAAAVADNDVIIVKNPMGRFQFAADPKITERWGTYTDYDLDLLEYFG